MLKKVLSVLLACTLIAALSVTAMAAGSSIKVPVNNDKSYTVSGIIDTNNYQMNVEPNNWFSKFPKESKVYTIETGTEISLVGMGSWSVAALQLKDGKLVTKEDNDWPKLLIITEKKDDGAGLRYVKGSSIKFIAEGYYIFTAADFTPMGLNYEDYAVVLHVVKSGTTSEKGKTNTTTTEKTTTKTTDKTTTTTKPADKNTVKIAGENRTPGEIQSRGSGDYLYTVKSGDTLYDIAKRYYGNGNLWKELQKANQKWLDETKNGIIFVGYNLILPAELGDVRVKV